MPDVRIPLKGANGRLNASVIPDVPRFPNAVAAGAGKVPVSKAGGTWDYVDQGAMGGGGGGGSIAATRFAPAVATTKVATTTAPTDVDASLLYVGFVAPSSGKVQVDLSATVHGSLAATRTFWALREGGTFVPGTLVMVHEGTTPDRASASIIVTGLTPGQNYLWKWAAAASSGTTTITAGGSAVDTATGGQATMVVRESPFG